MQSFLVRKINNFTKTLSLRAKLPNTYGTRLYVNYFAIFLAGIILSAKGVAYTVGSIPTGYLTDKRKFARTTFIFYVLSPLLAAIGLIISGLQAFIAIMVSSLVRLIAPSLLVSIGSGIGAGPMLRFMLSIWKGLNPQDTADYTIYLSSLLLVTYCLGGAFGINMGGFLFSFISFEQVLGFWGCAAFVHFLTNATFVLCFRNKLYMTFVRQDTHEEHNQISNDIPLIQTEYQNLVVPL